MAPWSYQRDSSGDHFPARSADYNLYVTIVICQNRGSHGRERSLSRLGEIKRRWVNIILNFMIWNVKICHLIIVDDTSVHRSVSTSKPIRAKKVIKESIS